MNRFNRSRRKQVETYEVGALVEYRCDPSGMEPFDLLAIVLEYMPKEGYYLIRFMDDGSILHCIHSEICRAEAA